MKNLFLLILFIFSSAIIIAQNAGDEVKTKLFQLEELTTQLERSESPWLGFFKNKNVMSGIYKLKTGSKDQQKPHTSDELYYVLEGKAKFWTEDQEMIVQPGSILFVKAEVEHHFFEIAEDLLLLVFFDQ